MLDITQTDSYKRLDKLLLWPLIGFIGLVLVIVISLIYLIYLKHVPELMAFLMEQSLSTEALIFLESGINKIIVNLSIWIFILLLVNVLLVYVTWNTKKLLADLRKMEREKDYRG